jgi:hypothetical protein
LYHFLWHDIKIQLLTHFGTDLGIGIRKIVAPNPAPFFCIGGTSLDLLWMTEGNILQSGSSSNLFRTQLEIELNSPEAITQLLEKPLGNHLILIFGHYRNLFENYDELFVKQAKQVNEDRFFRQTNGLGYLLGCLSERGFARWLFKGFELESNLLIQTLQPQTQSISNLVLFRGIRMNKNP